MRLKASTGLTALVAAAVLAGCTAGGDTQAVPGSTAPVVAEQDGDAGVPDDSSSLASDEPATHDSTDDALETAPVPSGAELTAHQEAELIAQQDAERAEAAGVLELPPGAQFGPPEVFTEPAWYEEGSFASLMAIDWRCAWLSTGVKQVDAGDEAGVAETVEILRSFADTPYAAAFVDFDYVISAHIDPLLDGDTSGALEYLQRCPPETIVD